jgi:hypothetical protein
MFRVVGWRLAVIDTAGNEHHDDAHAGEIRFDFAAPLCYKSDTIA